MSVTPSFSELKTILKPMSWKDRIEYLWTYYKVVLVVVAVALAIISMVVSAIQSKQIQTLLSGALINLSVEQEDQDKMVNELTALLDGDGKKRIVKLTDIAYIPGNDPENFEINDAAAMKLAMLVTTGSLDYILTDDGTYAELIERELYANLQNILTQEQQTHACSKPDPFKNLHVSSLLSSPVPLLPGRHRYRYGSEPPPTGS